MKYLILTLVLVIAGCGGGGGGSGVQPTTSSQPATQSNVVVLQGKVIDGYVSGATVFVDMNWSLAYEQGEPKTTTDANGNWEFKQSDFSSFTCHKGPRGPRAIIVDVPAGAVDTTRGVVSSPYRMIFLPAFWLNLTTDDKIVNITPFTTLFSAAITEGLQQTSGATNTVIPVSESCGTLASAIANNVRLSVDSMGKSFQEAGLPINKFYDDFIATGDKAAQAKGELIVDYLAKYKTISDLLIRELQLENGSAPNNFNGYYGFNANAIKDIVNGNPQTVAFDVLTYAKITPSSTGRSYTLSIDMKGLRLRKDGAVISSSCQNADPYSCPVIVGTSSQALTKASSNVIKMIWKQENDSYVFRKALKNNVFDCQAEHRYSYEPKITPSNTPTVSQLEVIYLPSIENKQNLYDCSTGDEGIRLAKRVDYTPRSNGYKYSTFQYSAPQVTSVVTSRFSYAISHFTQPIQSTILNETQLQNELNTLPSNPKQLDSILSTFPDGRWMLVTGSDTEVAMLYVNATTNVFTCLVRSMPSGSILRETNGSREQAVSACYPDTSMF